MDTDLVDASEVTSDSVMKAAVGDLPEDPVARAQERLSRLRSTFAASIAIVAQMHQDRDWEHLTREDGSAYTSLAEVMVDVFNVSASMARRYVQGARDFYVPLSELTVDGTRIEITSGDVAKLGQSGIAEVVDTARERLEGVEDPEEASRIISDSVAETKGRAEGAGAEGGADFDGYDPEPAPARPERGQDYGADMMGDLPDDDGSLDTGPAADAYGPVYTGLEEDEDDASGSGVTGSGSDAVERILAGASSFAGEEDRTALPPRLREVAHALHVLAGMDPVEVGELIDYDTRGVLLPAGDALTAVKRLRSTVETAPWFIARMTQE